MRATATDQYTIMSKLDGRRRKQVSSDYNIYNQIKCPVLMGDVNKDSSNFSVRGVIDAVSKNVANYVAAYPISGVNTDYAFGDVAPNYFYNGRDQALGSNYFVPIGKCDETDSDRECRGQDRWVYVRDIPTGKIPLVGNISFHGLTGCNLPGITEGRGIIPGLLEDISDIQPLSLLEAVGGSGNIGSFTCKRRRYPVGKNIYDPQMECPGGASPEACAGKTWWMENRCTPSTHHLKTATDGNTRKFPGGPPLFELFAPGTGGGTWRGRGRGRCAALAVGVLLLLLVLVAAVVSRRAASSLL